MTSTLTLDDIAKFDDLEYQRKRVLAQGYTLSNIPTGPDHKKYIEYNQLRQSIASLPPAGAVANEQTAVHLSSLPVMDMLRSMFPTQDPHAMLGLLFGAAKHNASIAQASTPQPHMCPQALLTHSLPSGAFCRLCIPAIQPHLPFPIGAPCLAHGLPARPHHESYSISTPATGYVTEMMPRVENEQTIAENDGECDDEVERESTQICLYLGNEWHSGMSADVYRDSTENWISDKLLRHPDDVIKPSECTDAYRAPDGIRSQSRGRIKIDYRLYYSGKTFPGVWFQVHASRSCAPGIVLGKSWAQKHGAAASFSRRPGNTKNRRGLRNDLGVDSRPKHNRPHALGSNRIMKLPQRPNTHSFAQMSR